MSTIRRSACKRCRKDKLKRIKASRDVCCRCQESKVACIFATARPTGRPATSSKQEKRKSRPIDDSINLTGSLGWDLSVRLPLFTH